MKLIKALLCFLLPAVSFAQADTMYYNKKGRTCGKDSASTYSFVVKDAQGWLRKEFYAKDNSIYTFGYFTAENCALRNGLSVWYWSNGCRDSVFYENNTIKEGWYFHANGAMSAHEIYKDGELHKSYAWDETGKKIAGEEYEKPLKKYGYATWKDYVETNMERNLPKSYQKGKIFGKVMVKFLVKVDGSVTDVTLERSSGFTELDEHALNIVRNSPPWTTILAHGRKVNGTMFQQFDFPKNEPDAFGD